MVHTAVLLSCLFFEGLAGGRMSRIGDCKLVIYFIPFQVETYEPITPENIREKATYRICVESEKAGTELLGIVSARLATKGFDSRKVRLLIEDVPGAHEILVDSEGHLRAAGEEGVLRRKDFARLKRLLSRIVAQSKSDETRR